MQRTTITILLHVLLLTGFPLPVGETHPGSAPATGPSTATLYDSIRTDLDDYGWPTLTSRAMTSAFGEYRSTHFHAGIDISPGDTIGLPALAARDGHIARVTINPTGYGKFLLIRHADGYSTAYAHLDGFPAWLDTVIRGVQMREERYPVDIEFPPGAYPVKAGQVVAYVGETGSGTAHLHFEIRDENNNTVNPLLTTGITIADRLPPVVRGLVITPLDHRSTVDGGSGLRTIAVRQTGPGEYIAQGVPVVAGSAGIAIDVRDRSDHSRFMHGVHTLDLFIDGSRVMGVRYDRVPLREGHQIRLVYLQEAGVRARFHKLFIDTYHRLPIFPGFGPGSGVIHTDRIPAGAHTFTIVATDFNGNKSRVTGSFRTDVPAAPPSRKPLADGEVRIDPDSAGTVATPVPGIMLSYPAGAVFSPVDLRLTPLEDGDGSGVGIAPHGVPLDGGIFVHFPDLPDDRQVAAYTRTGNSWTYHGRVERGPDGKAFVRLRRFLGDCALLTDTVPPQITHVTVSNNSSRPVISFRFRDDLSGVEYKSVKVYIDGRVVIPEIDGEHRRATAQPTTPLTRGSHRLTIQLSDRMGNRAAAERSFHVR